MLLQIHLTNFVVIETLELDFSNGMTALTGETGAGKSIIIDALDLALGGRLNTKVVRTGSERCDITVTFSIKNNSAAKQWLTEHELLSDEECIIRRTITKQGKSKNYINGQPVPLQLSRQLGAMLVSIHGQHEHQNLVKREHQRILVDDYAGNLPLCEMVNSIYLDWLAVKEKISNLQTLSKDHNQRCEFLQYQLNEFAKLALQEGELEQLTKEHKQLAHADEFIENCQKAMDLINDDETHSLMNLVNEILQTLEIAQQVNSNLGNSVDLLKGVNIQLEEAATDIRHHLDSAECKPERLHWLEDRLSKIDELARKHRVPAEELLALQQKLQSELDELEHSDENLEALEQRFQILENEYHKAAKSLSKKRQDAGKTLADLVTQNMHQLGMSGGKFNIELSCDQNKLINAHGYESIQFMVSANPGQALQPLNKVASGGELSRISLAIQVITSQRVQTPTLIFDEVDVGIGGGIAEIIGRLLRKIGEKTQVMCVTHLPQVAAKAHQHFQVKKSTQNESTQTEVKELSTAEKTQEIARMLGGIKITKQTLAHAEEMLEL